MIVTTSDAEITKNKRINEQVGFIRAKIETIRQCYNDIDSVTEQDIWGAALAKVWEGTEHLNKLANSRMVR